MIDVDGNDTVDLEEFEQVSQCICESELISVYPKGLHYDTPSPFNFKLYAEKPFTTLIKRC